MNSIQFWIAIIFGIIWLALKLLRRKPPEDTEQQREGNVILTESEVNLPWQQIPQGQEILEEYEEEVVEQIKPVEEKKEPSIPQTVFSPAIPTEPKRKSSQRDTNSTDKRSQQSPGQPKQIAGIPLNTQNVKFGIVLSEILNKPKSQRLNTNSS